MNSIKGWVALIAVTAILSAVFCALVPGGRTKSAFFALVGMVFVCAVLSPLSSEKKFDFDFFEDFFNYEENESLYENQSRKAEESVAKKGYEKAVRQVIEKLGYVPQRVSAECDENLKLKKISVTVNGDFSSEKVVSEIKKIFSDAEIEIKKGESDERET